MTISLILDPKVRVTTESKWSKSAACAVVVCEAGLEPLRLLIFHTEHTSSEAQLERFLIPYFSVHAIIQFVVNIFKESRLKGKECWSNFSRKRDNFPALLCSRQQRVVVSV